MNTKCRNICCSMLIGFFLINGIMLIVTGVLLPSMIQQKLNGIFQDIIVVDSNSSQEFAAWQAEGVDPTLPSPSVNFYIFNITNVDAYMAGEKPILQQVGPYAYKNILKKIDYSFPRDGVLSKSKTWSYFLYDPIGTVGNPMTDVITTLNIPFGGIRKAMTPDEFLLLCVTANCSMLVQQTAHELMWGYEDPFLQFLSKFKAGVDTSVAYETNMTSEEYARQNTSWNMVFTGKGDLDLINEYFMWQGQLNLNIWGSEEANSVSGTDGTQFKPNMDKDENVQVWTEKAFRKIAMNYQEDVEVQGVKLRRYGINPNQLQNVTLNPDNAAYFAFGSNGVFNLSASYRDAPVFLSKPHFLDGDESLITETIGLKPDKNLHDISLDVEPMTGKTFRVAERYQVSMSTEPIPYLFPHVAKVDHLPIMWIEVIVNPTVQVTSKFHIVYTVLAVMKYAPIIGAYSVGPVFVILAIVLIVVFYRRRRTQKRDDYHTLPIQYQ